METILRLGLGNAAAAGLLALGAGAAGLFAGRRPALRHGLWLLVLLKLVTPPLWRVPVPSVAFPATTRPAVAFGPAADGSPARPGGAPGPDLLPEGGRGEIVVKAPGEVVVEVRPGGTASAPDPSASAPPVSETSEAGLRPPRADPTPARDAPGEPWGWPWASWLLAAWGVGSSLTFGLSAWRIARFGRLLRLAVPANGALRAKVEALAERMGLGAGRVPEVWEVPGEVSPMVWAPGCRPRLIVPRDLWKRLDARQHATLLAHELAHLKRRDHWVRGLELLATVLYWWLPVVWIARRSLREAEEQCCDAWVVWAFPGSARAYAEALLETLDFLSGADPAAAVAASGIGPVHHLKRRMTMILKGTTPRALSRGGLLAVLGLSAALLPLSVTWAQQRADVYSDLDLKLRNIDIVLRKDLADQGTPSVEARFFDTLRAGHEFDDPRWPFQIKARDVQDKTLIDATFKHRAGDPKNANSFDMIVQARKAVVRFDTDKGVAHIQLDGTEVVDPRGDVSLNDKQILDVAIPTVGDAPELEDDEAPDDDSKKPETRDPGPRAKAQQDRARAQEDRARAQEDRAREVRDKVRAALQKAERVKRDAIQRHPEFSRELREAMEELQAKIEELVPKEPGEPPNIKARAELEKAVRQLQDRARALASEATKPPGQGGPRPKRGGPETKQGPETKRDEAETAKLRAEVERLKEEVRSRHDALREAESQLARAAKQLAEAQGPLARDNPFIRQTKNFTYAYPDRTNPRVQVFAKPIPGPDQDRRFAELEERVLGKLQEEVKSLKKQESKAEKPE